MQNIVHVFVLLFLCVICNFDKTKTYCRLVTLLGDILHCFNVCFILKNRRKEIEIRECSSVESMEVFREDELIKDVSFVLGHILELVDENCIMLHVWLAVWQTLAWLHHMEPTYIKWIGGCTIWNPLALYGLAVAPYGNHLH